MPRFPCLFRGKYLLENAGNGISECLGFKIFWGNMSPDPGGGGYSYTLPIWVCAAQWGRDFEAPDLEWGIHFRGVF